VKKTAGGKRAQKVLLAVTVGVLCVALGVLVYVLDQSRDRDVVQVPEPVWRDYEVYGVDVSAHQGDIDWPVLADQVDFAFMKATEGGTFVDPNFAVNWDGAQATGIPVGAYHFFRFDVSAEDQAANFNSNVPNTPGMLPPVIDFELYGDLQEEPNRPTRDAALNLLRPLEDALYQHYGVRPIIYANTSTYNEYLSGEFPDNPLWVAHYTIDHHTFYPVLSDRKQWTFWQHTDSGILNGYSGGNPNIDLDVFSGTKADWNAFLGKPA
jgi:lysozyme